MDPRTRRSPARFLAPLALIAVVVALLAIISGSGSNNSAGTDTGASSGPPAATSTSKTTSSSRSSKTSTRTTANSGPKAYTVQVGDTLGSIADKTGVPLETIQTLNPDVDPHAMVAGQKIKLR